MGTDSGGEVEGVESGIKSGSKLFKVELERERMDELDGKLSMEGMTELVDGDGDGERITLFEERRRVRLRSVAETVVLGTADGRTGIVAGVSDQVRRWEN